MSKQRDLAVVAREASAGFVNVTGDTMTGGLITPSVTMTDAFFPATGYNQWKQTNFLGDLFLNNGVDRFKIDSSGRVTMPYQPMAYVEYGQPTVSAGATLDLSGGTVGLNVGNIYNSANGRYTVPVSGVYRLTMGSQGKTTANINAGSLYYRVNGGGLTGQTLFYGDAFSGNQSEFLLSLVANDYVQVSTFGNNSVTYTHNGVRATFELVS